MPRKSALLLSLLNLMLKPRAGQASAPSKQHVTLLQQPLPTDRDAWRVHWQARDQPWRIESEIDEKRQKELSKRRAIVPDIKQGIYPFKGMKLNRSDVEWLLATHEHGRGPIDWSDERQRDREGLALRGADLSEVNLSGLPLARTRGGVTHQERMMTTRPQHRMAATHLERANLFQTYLEGATFRSTHLEGANLESAHLEHADCAGTHFEDAYLRRAYLDGTYLRRAFFDGATFLNEVSLGNENVGFASLVDVRWNGVNLATIQWKQMEMLGDEERARRKRDDTGKVKDHTTQLLEYEIAVRANRQLATELQSRGLNEDAARFTYRSQVLQKRVWWFQMIQSRAKLKQRGQAVGAWLFSWFLFLLAGYGYRLWRSFLVYVVVIIGFTTAYYLLGATFKPSLSLVNALGLSMTSFHGRGFFPGVTQLDDTLTILASLEAFVGLILEATFIATLTQRFFGK